MFYWFCREDSLKSKVNTCDWNAHCKVNLETLNGSVLENKFIKFSINDSNPQVINRYKETDTFLKAGKIFRKIPKKCNCRFLGDHFRKLMCYT